MVDYQQQASRLRVSASLLSEEYDRMSLTNLSIASTSENLKKTHTKYDAYGNEIGKASKLVKEIKEK